MTIDKKIDKYMNEYGINNLKNLSLKANIPYTTLFDLYTKKSIDNSRLSTIKKLASVIGCTLDYLVYDDIDNLNELKIDGLDLSDNKEDFDFTKIEEYNKNTDKRLLEHYKTLFDKDEYLTDNQKEFIMNTIIEQHKKSDN